MKFYKKLVRDKIPEIIKASGGRCAFRLLSDKDYLAALDAKLAEELAEYQESHSVEELADLLEVIYAAAKARGCSAETLDRIREEKAAERGRFDKKILLMAVREAQK